MAYAMETLYDELERLKATDIVVTMSGDAMRPLSKQKKRVEEPGVALYFQRGGAFQVVAQDRYDTFAGNVRSLALAIKAMRDLERHGGGVIAEKAFEGLTGVPAVTEDDERQSRWWERLGVSPTASLAAIRGAWKAQTADAQKQGDMELASALNSAWADAQKAVAARRTG
ncbi:MAG: hypothetical protein AAF661_05090 [Pseudomonadota bacterium]